MTGVDHLEDDDHGSHATVRVDDRCPHCGEQLQQVEVYDRDTLQTVDYVLSCANSYRWEDCPEVFNHEV